MKTCNSRFINLSLLILLAYGCMLSDQAAKHITEHGIRGINRVNWDSLIHTKVKNKPIIIPVVRQQGDTIIVYDSLTKSVLHENHQLLSVGMVVEANFYRVKDPSGFLLNYRYTGSRTKRSCLYYLQYQDSNLVLKDFGTFYWGEEYKNKAFGWLVQNINTVCNQINELENQEERMTYTVINISPKQDEITYKLGSMVAKDTIKQGQTKLPIFDIVKRKYFYYNIENKERVTDYDLCRQILLHFYQK